MTVAESGDKMSGIKDQLIRMLLEWDLPNNLLSWSTVIKFVDS